MTQSNPLGPVRLLLLLALVGCSCGDPPTLPDDGSMPDSGLADGAADADAMDAGDDASLDAGADAASDAGSDADIDDGGADAALPEVVEPSLFSSSGGGSASTASNRVRFSVGAPQPMGLMSSNNHRVVLGPLPAR